MAHNYPTDSDDVLRNAKILGFFEGRRLADTYHVYAMNFMLSPIHDIIIAPVYTTQKKS